jgi:hypothetical protein
LHFQSRRGASQLFRSAYRSVPTLTLDDDVAARLQAEVRRTGRSFKTVVNERLRIALARSATVQKRKPFKVEPRAMGGPAVGFSYDNIEKLLDDVEGAHHA